MPLIVVQPLKREEAGQFISFFASRCKGKSFALKLVCKSEAETTPTVSITSVPREVRLTCKNAVGVTAPASEPRVRSVNEVRVVTKPREKRCQTRDCFCNRIPTSILIYKCH